MGLTDVSKNLDPSIDLTQNVCDMERQLLDYSRYFPSCWNGRSLSEEYRKGNMAVILDLVPRREIHVERAVSFDSVGVQFMRPTSLVFHSSVVDARVAYDWRQQTVLVRDVQIVESAQAIIPSTVRLYIRPHSIEQPRSGHVYISPRQRRVELLQCFSERELGVAVHHGGTDLPHNGNPGVIKRGSEIVDGIPEHESYFVDETGSFGGIVFERHDSTFRVVLNSGNVTILQLSDRCFDIRDVLFGPIDFE